MAKNPVPCHRVLAAGGKVGGFSAPGGSAAKIRMLALEGAHVEPGLADIARGFRSGAEFLRQAMDPFVVLAAASQVTKRIKFGTGVALIQQRDVIQTAKLVASIDQVSQGRFLFGVAEPTVRAAACRCARSAGPHLGLLIKLLDDPHREVATAAALALGRIAVSKRAPSC